MGSELEKKGALMDKNLWCGTCSVEFPELVKKVHEDYIEAGADGIFPEAMTNINHYKDFKNKIKAPILANMTEFGKTPLSNLEELSSVGVDMVLYPLSAFRAMSKAALTIYKTIKNNGHQKDVLKSMQTRDELYEFLDYNAYEEKLDELFIKGKNS